MDSSSLVDMLGKYHPSSPAEVEMLHRTIKLVEDHPSECANRSLLSGHLTASAWILNSLHTHVLLTHHRKLERWLQLGGHADGDLDLERVALREAQEESGLTSVHVLSHTPFDIDIHTIPAKADVPEHLHYDVRFLFTADQNEPFIVSDESIDLEWVALDRLAKESLTNGSMQRLINKTPSAN